MLFIFFGIQDLQCYKRIKPLLDDFENNYNFYP